jgi:hypothetical protein
MIPAPPGVAALYKHDNAPDTDKTIIAFDDDGHPLVIDDSGKRDKTRLVRADSWTNYDGMTETAGPITALLPAGGWRVEYTEGDGTTWSEPLVGWGLKGDSIIVPLATDCDGYVDDFDHHRGTYRIYHPDATDIPAADDPAQEARPVTTTP